MTDSQGQENKDVRKSVGSLLMSSMKVSRLEQRAYIKIAVLRGQNARECHAQLLEAVGARALPYRTVARWVAAFESGREATKDKPRTGRCFSCCDPTMFRKRQAMVSARTIISTSRFLRRVSEFSVFSVGSGESNVDRRGPPGKVRASRGCSSMPGRRARFKGLT
ncbi:hypothetical protein C0J52_24118 [Blattella germanica]|nr:hypothetical protein C0J52_24118 [Blattella germanica]